MAGSITLRTFWGSVQHVISSPPEGEFVDSRTQRHNEVSRHPDDAAGPLRTVLRRADGNRPGRRPGSVSHRSRPTTSVAQERRARIPYRTEAVRSRCSRNPIASSRVGAFNTCSSSRECRRAALRGPSQRCGRAGPRRGEAAISPRLLDRFRVRVAHPAALSVSASPKSALGDSNGVHLKEAVLRTPRCPRFGLGSVTCYEIVAILMGARRRRHKYKPVRNLNV